MESETWVWDRQVVHILSALPVTAILRLLAYRLVNRFRVFGSTPSVTMTILSLLFLLGIAYFEFTNIGSGDPVYKSMVDISVWGAAILCWNLWLRSIGIK